MLGHNNLGTGCCNLAVGFCNCVTSNSSQAFGKDNCSTACCSVVIGNSSCSTHCNAVVLGSGLSSQKENTVHVNNLISYGQGASIAHVIGNTGGTVVLDWDNSNVQTLTLTSNVTTLTKCNPINGGVYTLFVTSGSSGSSGTSGIDGNVGSSGSSGTSGTDGSSGTSGVNGATGPAGATGAGASSPIVLNFTNSLISTAVGATGCAPNSVVIGLNYYGYAIKVIRGEI